MPDPRVIISGDSGTFWVNDTGRPTYQLIASLINTCGLCLQYHLKIARFWALGLHKGCRCRQVRIAMGEAAPYAFVDYRAIALEMAPPDQAKLMGASNFKLWRAGVIEWQDAVTASRVRPLNQVVANKRLTVDQMTRAGVRRDIAQAAFDAVHTPEHEAVRLHRRQLLQNLAAAGVHQDAVVQHIASRITARTVIQTPGIGPIALAPAAPPPIPMSAVPPPLPVPMPPPLPAQPPPLPIPTPGRSQADAFKAEATRAALGGLRRLPEPARRLIEAELGSSAARNIPAFVAAVAAGLADDRIYPAAILALYDRYRRR